MPTPLRSIVPDIDVLLKMEPEDVGGVILQSISKESGALLHPQSFSYDPNPPSSLPAGQTPIDHFKREQYWRVLQEGWSWLVSEGLLVRDQSQPGGHHFVSRRGIRVIEEKRFTQYQWINSVPKKLIHPTIYEKVWMNLVKGDLDTAVFQAFKEVEVAVRAASSFPDTEFGTDMMRKAFDADSGPLTDPALPKAERQALSHLFAGAIGSYKNPHSHRTVSIADSEEAVEMILLASHLLRIVDARTSDPWKKSPSPDPNQPKN